MTREKAIDQIGCLYPADSQYPETAEVGKELLEQAKREIEDWRNLPTPILIRYARLCLEKERG